MIVTGLNWLLVHKVLNAKKCLADRLLKVFFDKVAQFRAAVLIESEIHRRALLLLIILDQFLSFI